MDIFTALAQGYGPGVAIGAIAGVGAIVVGVTAKVFQDRIGPRRGVAAAGPSLRQQAREQARQLDGRARVARGVPAGGQFAARQRGDADVTL